MRNFSARLGFTWEYLRQLGPPNIRKGCGMNRLLSLAAGLLVLGIPAPGLAVDKADVPRLIRQLGDRDNTMRRQAAQLLSQLGPDAKPAVDALSKALADEDIFVKRFAAKALGGIGPEAKSSVPALAKLLRDENEEVSDAAAEALGKMGQDAVNPLISAFKENDIYLKVQAAKALGKLGPDAAPAVSSLADAFRNPPKGKGRRTAAELQLAVADALGNIGPEAKPAVPALKAFLESMNRDRGLRQAVNAAIRKIENPRKKA